MQRFAGLVVAILLLGLSLPALADEKRVALIIGNGAYQNAPKLKNPVNDAKAMAALLAKLHYKVVLGTDLDQAGMVSRLRDFRKEAQGADIALIFYSGHGLQVAGQNWLLPVTVKMEDEHDLDYEAVKVDALLNEAEGAKKLRIVLLDACRDNPFKGKAGAGTRSAGATRGLARVETAGADTLIAYATRSDDVAQDGEGQDSPFTSAFLKHAETPGLDVRLLFGRVRDEVRALTGGKQEPAIYGSLGGEEIYLSPPQPGKSAKAPPPPPASASASASAPASPAAPADKSAADLAMWNSAEKLNTVESYREYLRKFPDGKFTGMAELRIKDLSDPKARQMANASNSGALLLLGADAASAAAPMPAPTRSGQASLLMGDSGSEAAAPAAVTVPGAIGGAGGKQAAAALPSVMAPPMMAKASPEDPAKPNTFRDCPDCPEMVVIPPGEFVMGSPQAETAREGVPEPQAARERPQHRVTIRSAFALGRYPVTRDEFSAFQAETGYRAQGCTVMTGKEWRADPARSWQNPGFEQSGRDPAVCLSRADAQSYVAWLNRRTGGTAYRLPGEAEWEYAARAGTTTARFWGDGRETACSYAAAGDQTGAEALGWDRSAQFPCRDGHVYTAPVGSYQPNAFGLYDMLGNAWQWTADCWSEDYSSAPADGRVAGTGECGASALRGGSWFNAAASVRSAQRYKADANSRNYTFGFRLAKTLP